MEWVIGGIVIVVIIVMIARSVRKADERHAATVRAESEAQDATYAREREERRNAREREWMPIFDRLPVVDAATSPLLHAPIYNCASDEFELPCAHRSFEFRDNHTYDGFPIGFFTWEEARDKVNGFADWSWSAAFVDGGDHADLIYVAAGNVVRDPGAKVWRFVRTGPDEVHVYGWRSGLRSEPDDPQFYVSQIVDNPRFWTDRLRMLQAKWAENGNYQYALRRCEHR